MWLRLYDDLPDDPKMDGLTNDQKWLWIVLMCLGSRAPIRGRLTLTLEVPVPMDSITKRTGMSPEAVSYTIETFRERDMMHREGLVWVLTHWDARQHESDSSAERTRKYREKKRGGDGNVTDGETSR